MLGDHQQEDGCAYGKQEIDPLCKLAIIDSTGCAVRDPLTVRKGVRCILFANCIKARGQEIGEWRRKKFIGIFLGRQAIGKDLDIVQMLNNIIADFRIMQDRVCQHNNVDDQAESKNDWIYLAVGLK